MGSSLLSRSPFHFTVTAVAVSLRLWLSLMSSSGDINTGWTHWKPRLLRLFTEHKRKSAFPFRSERLKKAHSLSIKAA